MDLFKLVGSIVIDSGDSKKKIQEVSDSAGSMAGNIGTSLNKAGTTMQQVGKKMLPVSAAVGGLGVAAVKTAANFDSSMSNVSAISGATGGDLQSLRDKAMEMGAKTKFSASESADAMSYMAMAGWKTADMINGIDGVMNLAAASGSDLATTSDILTDGLTAFGLSAGESGRMADVMAAASSNANTNVELLGESYKYCASAAGAMGYSVEDITESLGLMANAGVKGSQAGTTLKTAMINLAKPTKQMQTAMDKYGISITNSDGSMKSWNEVVGNLRTSLGGLSKDEQTAAVATIFGKEATAGMLSVINAAPSDVDKLSNAIKNSSGTAEEMANVMNDNLSGQITILKSGLESLAISFGELIVPAVSKCVTALQKAVTWLNSLSDGTKTVIVVIGGIVTAAAPVLIVIGKMCTGISSIISVAGKIAPLFSTIGGIITKVAGVFKVLWGVLMANPIILVIAAVAALVAGFVYLWNNCEAFRNFWIGLWDGIKNIVSGAVEAVTGFFSGLWSGITEIAGSIKEGVVGKFTELRDGAVELFNGMRDTIGGIFGGIRDKAGEIFGGVRDTVSGAVGATKDYVGGKLGEIQTAYEEHGGGIQGAVAGAMEGVRQGFSVGYDAVNTLTGGRLGDAVTTVGEKMGSIATSVGTKMGDVKTAFETNLGNAKTTVSTHMGNIFTNISTKIGNAKTTVGTKLGNIKTAFTTNLGNAKTTVATNMGNILTSFTTKIGSAKTTIGTKLGNIKTAFSTNLGDSKTTVTRLMGNISTAFGDKMETAKEKVKGAIDKIKGFFKFSWSLPKLKLPHVSITGHFGINPPSAPHFGISWYKKAYDNPLMFGRPTVIPTATGLKGFGDGGSDEMVYGKNNLMNDIGNVTAAQNSGIIDAINDQFEKLFALLNLYFPQFNQVPVWDTGVAAATLAPAMNTELGKIAIKKGRGR